MPGKSTISYGNVSFEFVIYGATVPYPSLTTGGAQGTTTFAIPGVQLNDCVTCSMNPPAAHLSLDNCYVSAPGVVSINWSTDNTSIGPGTVPVLFDVLRLESANLGLTVFPSAIA